ncbi:hypothetical protein H8S95_07325 [Pontibacter sp. KCTC 32443]|uniref:hypothetical protein n=1 Tax=Pontibacter TaxID=323449 RepID=UPI00164D09EC|nr:MULTISPECIES: hypothetical protein [Pontibacter]MBC5773869.1 hypothetical protein [Pontibacter sp. KCTC 32443]
MHVLSKYKLIILLAIISLTITGCWEKENDQPTNLAEGECRIVKSDQGDGVLSTLEYNSDGYLVKERAVYKSATGNSIYLHLYSYDADNKLVKYDVYVDDEPIEYTVYEYINGVVSLLKKYTYSDIGLKEEIQSFKYSTDNKVIEQIMGDYKSVYTYDENENIVLTETYFISTGKLMHRTRYEDYDDKPNYHSALKGIFLDPIYSSRNNHRKESNESVYEDGSVNKGFEGYYTYEYNGNGYPSKVTLTDDTGTRRFYNISYTYQCN